MKHCPIVIVSLTFSLLTGCSSDHRLADFAQQVTHEQAQQNQRVADSAQAIAKGSQQLVEADAEARGELIELQHVLRNDQAQIAAQQEALDQERRVIAHERLVDSKVSSGLIAVAILLVTLAPLVLAGISLLGLWREPTRAEEEQILIEELAREFLTAPSLQRLPPPEDLAKAEEDAP